MPSKQAKSKAGGTLTSQSNSSPQVWSILAIWVCGFWHVDGHGGHGTTPHLALKFDDRIRCQVWSNDFHTSARGPQVTANTHRDTTDIGWIFTTLHTQHHTIQRHPTRQNGNTNSVAHDSGLPSPCVSNHTFGMATSGFWQLQPYFWIRSRTRRDLQFGDQQHSKKWPQKQHQLEPSKSVVARF